MRDVAKSPVFEFLDRAALAADHEPWLVTMRILAARHEGIERLDADLRGINMACTLEEAISDAEALLLLVRHTEFRHLNPEDLFYKTKARIAMDCVNGWDAKTWQKAGFQFVRLGVRKS